MSSCQTPPSYIRHITLTTGHVRDCFADEIDAEPLAACCRLIEQLDGSSTLPIPGSDGYSLGGRTQGKCLVATVWADGPPSQCIASIGVAAHSRCGGPVWRALHRWGTALVATDPGRCPPEPWVAAALDASIVKHPDATEWLGDFERCLAWAWLAHLEARPS